MALSLMTGSLSFQGARSSQAQAQLLRIIIRPPLTLLLMRSSSQPRSSRLRLPRAP